MTLNNKKNRKIIGLTGGIATGKSTVTKILINKGYPVVDADKIAREVVEVGKPAYKDIVQEFGEEILNQDSSINRAKLGKIIFSNREHRDMLNRIVHPRVTEEIIRQTFEEFKGEKIVFLDIPLLIEERKRLEEQGLTFDEVWLVYTNDETQLVRLIKRDNIDKEQALKRVNAQMPIDEKKEYSDVIIDNTGDLIALEKELSKLLKKYN